MTTHQRAPHFLARAAHEDFKHHVYKIENKRGPDANVDADIEKHISLSYGTEDSKVLQKNR